MIRSRPCIATNLAAVARVILALASASLLHAASASSTAEQNVFFETKIRPVLAELCVECHGPETQEAELRLDSRNALLKGSDSGAVVASGRPAESSLIAAIKHTGDVKMPKRKPALPAQTIADFERWVAEGLPWPDYLPPLRPATPAAQTEPAGPRLRPRKFAITEADRRWWSFQPVQSPRPPTPASATSSTNPIDAFLLSRLTAKGLTLSPVASRREQLRRAYFDVVGLPPTPQAIEAFERDTAPDAWEKQVEALLARPQFGERWARHWLDVVRYAETNGYERDGAKPHAWRYRDYVIKALNEDKPYDRFIIEQLAGDELPGPFNEEAIVATGFYRLHVWDDEPDSTVAAEFDDLDDIMVTTSTAFLGLTLGCARCHDHKFDPFSQKDYYQLLAHFRSISPYGVHKTGGGNRATGRILRPLAPPEIAAPWQTEQAERLDPLRAHLAANPDQATKRKLEAEIQRIEADAPFGFALAVTEDPLRPTHVLRRGDPLSPADEVSPGLPGVLAAPTELPAESSSEPTTAGRRLSLATWIARPDNPLTARVMVNRIWQHYFGRGLVVTPNDVGRTGAAPSHPELLDYLASEFIRGGWKPKRLHRLILTSHAYRMSSRGTNERALAADEANELFWRQNPRRLDAESVRDSILAVSGSLNAKMGGPSVYLSLPKEVHRTQDKEGKGWKESPPEEQTRRSVYVFIKRALLPPLLETFDYTTTTLPVGQRSITTVAPQALMLLNDAFVQQQGARLAERVALETTQLDDAAQVRRAFALTLQRPPTEAEVQSSLEMLARQRELAPTADARSAFRNFCVALFNLNEFIYVD